MDIRKQRGRPKRQPSSNVISRLDESLQGEIEQYKKFNCKNFRINLSLNDAFLDSSHVLTDDMQIEKVNFGSSMIDDASKRKSFPLISRKKQGNIFPKLFLRRNSNTDNNELNTYDTSNDLIGRQASVTDDENMVSSIQNENKAMVPFEDQNKFQRKISACLEFTDCSVNKIKENEPDALEHINRNIDYNEMASSENMTESTPEDQLNSVNSVDKLKPIPEHESGVKKQPPECEAQEHDISITSEFSPRRKTVEVLRQLETTLNPKMTDLSNNNQDNVKVSRFGRHQKMKSGFDDFIPVEITRFINVSPSKQKKKIIPAKMTDLNNSENRSTSSTNCESAISESSSSPKMVDVQLPEQDQISPQAIKAQNSHLGGEEQILSGADSALGSSVDELSNNLSNGHILWGSVANSVFWPCIVCPDPDSNQIIIKKKSGTFAHVRFFSDNGRRCWLKTQKALEFNGIEDLDTKLLETANLEKKQKRVPSISQRAFWKSAIMQAQEFITYKQHDRYEKYLQLLEKERLERTEQSKLKRTSLSTTISAENLSKFQSERNRKRSRSASPDSPVFEILTAEGIKQEVEEDRIRSSCIDRFFKSIDPQSKHRPPPKKKIRLDLGGTPTMPQDMNQDSSAGDEIDNDALFQQFFEGLKATILTSNSTDLIAELKLYAKRIWLLKIFDTKQVCSDNLSKISKNLNRKLSLRKRSSSSRSRRSSATTTTDSVKSLKKPSSNELGEVAKASKALKIKKEELSLKEMFLSELEKNYLFKTMTREPVCSVCRKTGGLIKCSGECGGHFHPICCIEKEESHTKEMQKYKVYKVSTEVISGFNNVPKLENSVKLEPIETDTVEPIHASASTSEQFQCNECSSNKPHKCFVCKRVKEPTGSNEGAIKCCVNGCGKFFHIACLKNFPQSIIDETSAHKSVFCPQHCCHTCVSDDPKQKTNRKDNKPPLIKCVACPTSYHFDSGCVPAGSEFLTASQIICSKHSVEGERKSFININWCFICSLGGTLLCCEQCPTSFHQECLDINLPIQERYICDVCESGRMPLYNEIVWAKYSIHRWWPAIILPPPVVPEIMLKKQHSAFEFCIRFFGSHDFCWIKRERVFLYQEGDSNSLKKTDKPVYNQALIEAKEIFEYLQEQKQNDPHRFDNRPPFYTRIKCNRPVPPVKLNGNEERDINDDVCDCIPNDEEPCGPFSNCINRTLNQECNPATCPAGLKCCNQYFKNRKYPKMKVHRTPGRGWGLNTLEEIKAGSFVIEYVGELIDNTELENRLSRKAAQNDENYYFLTINANLIIDAGPKGNLSRFMNHSCEPNCQTQKWTVGGQTRVGLFAIQDIQPNTELTFNYNLEAIGDRKKICQCGAKTCSGFIGALKTDSKKSQTNLKKRKKVVESKSLNIAASPKSLKLVDVIHVTGDDTTVVYN